MLSAFKLQFMSDIGEFLQNFDQKNPKKSVSQQKEIAKHTRIAQLRDGTAPPEPSANKKIWEGF